jgi:hypothetical protein
VPDIVSVTATKDGEVVPSPGYDGPTVTVGGIERPVLWASESGDRQSVYDVRINGNIVTRITVPSGSDPIKIQDLIALGVTETDPEYTTILSYILGLSRGTWSSSEDYDTGSLVERSGSIYRATSYIASPSPDPLLGSPWELWLSSAVTLPNGGETNAVLYKVSGVDQDVDWTTGPTLKKVSFDTAQPATLDAAGDLAWDDLDQALSYRTDGITVEIGQENLVYVRNPSGGTTIPKGAAVAVDGASSNRLRVKLCNSVEGGDGCRTLGVAINAITAPGFGFVSTFGLLRNFNTNSIIGGGVAPGSELFISSTPGVLSTQPQPSPGRRVTVGYVVTTGNSGSIFVTVRRGLTINELDNVLAANPTDGQVLRYVTAAGRYELDTLTASDIAFDGQNSGLQATNLQAAIEEIKALISS